MKKNYNEPEVIITLFTSSDVIKTSGNETFFEWGWGSFDNNNDFE